MNNHNAQHEGSFETDAVKCSPSLNLKPAKSSLKISKRLPEVPEVSITCESPDLPLSLRTLCEKEDAADEGIPAVDQGSNAVVEDADMIPMNGMPSPSLSESGSPEKRRPSAVTFNETTQIIQIARKKR
jgi:hypothetical protein